MEWEPIFKAGCEGGCLTVLGKRGANGEWSFLMVRDETTMREFVEDLTDEEVYAEDFAATWEGVLAKMDRYPWAMLYPLEPLHKEFKDRIWEAVLARTTDEYERRTWQAPCGKSPE